MKITKVIARCSGCKRDKAYVPDKTLLSAEDLIAWTETALVPCPCGAKTCDLRIPLEQVE